jgi:hypothetical protein
MKSELEVFFRSESFFAFFALSLSLSLFFLFFFSVVSAASSPSTQLFPGANELR